MVKEEIDEQLDEQEELLQQFCENQGYELVDVFREGDTSARKHVPVHSDREEFQKMCAALRQDKSIEGVVVQTDDRLTRQAAIAVAIKEYIEAAIWDGTVGEHRELTILQAMAEYEDDIDPEIKSLTSFEEISAADFFHRAAMGFSSQSEKQKEIAKVKSKLDGKITKGRPPRGIRTADEEDKYLPKNFFEDKQGDRDRTKEFDTAVAVLNEVADGTSKTQAGRNHNFPEGSEWDIVDRMVKNAHVYLMAAKWSNKDWDVQFEELIETDNINKTHAAALEKMGVEV